MTINKYTELKSKARHINSDVCRYLNSENMCFYGSLDSLLWEVKEVIFEYEDFITSLADKIKIEDCVKNLQNTNNVI